MSECNERCDVSIAIVEDEKDLVSLYQNIFARKGFIICFVANDGLEAVEKYTGCTPKPHIVIMDYRLPRMSGIDATTEILKIDPDAKVAFLSADASVKDAAINAGAFIFLEKPVSIREIMGAVKRGFEERR